MTAPRPIIFRTRVDRWLLVLLVGSLVGGLGICALVAVTESAAEGWLGVAIVLGTTLFVVALSVPTEYVLAEDALVVRFGLFRSTIPLATIERVYPTRNPLSAPAWSLDRLGIRYRTRERPRLMLVSPAETDAFLAALAERAGLERRGSELVRPVRP
ncbi:MAG: PH domain-containing protein [Rubricoccaceae bacterium]|nr:PH domain-containing protein [Rubricoccaceae bacterium]